MRRGGVTLLAIEKSLGSSSLSAVSLRSAGSRASSGSGLECRQSAEEEAVRSG